MFILNLNIKHRFPSQMVLFIFLLCTKTELLDFPSSCILKPLSTKPPSLFRPAHCQSATAQLLKSLHSPMHWNHKSLLHLPPALKPLKSSSSVSELNSLRSSSSHTFSVSVLVLLQSLSSWGKVSSEAVLLSPVSQSVSISLSLSSRGKVDSEAALLSSHSSLAFQNPSMMVDCFTLFRAVKIQWKRGSSHAAGLCEGFLTAGHPSLPLNPVSRFKCSIHTPPAPPVVANTLLYLEESHLE